MVSHELLPQPLLDLFNKHGGKRLHQNIQAHQNVAFNSTFLCKSITTYNQLPLNIKQKKSVHSFLGKAKQIHIY